MQLSNLNTSVIPLLHQNMQVNTDGHTHLKMAFDNNGMCCYCRYDVCNLIQSKSRSSKNRRLPDTLILKSHAESVKSYVFCWLTAQFIPQLSAWFDDVRLLVPHQKLVAVPTSAVHTACQIEFHMLCFFWRQCPQMPIEPRFKLVFATLKRFKRCSSKQKCAMTSFAPLSLQVIWAFSQDFEKT